MKNTKVKKKSSVEKNNCKNAQKLELSKVKQENTLKQGKEKNQLEKVVIIRLPVYVKTLKT